MTVSPCTIAITHQAANGVSSLDNTDLAGRIYHLLESDTTLKTGLGLADKANQRLVHNIVIPRLLAVRDEMLSSADDVPTQTRALSSKNPLLQFDSYGKANIRVQNGTTYIALPHMPVLKGFIKQVRYSLCISPDNNDISVQMNSKIQQNRRSPERSAKYKKIATLLQSFKHPNILVPTDVLSPSAKNTYEVITPKCEIDLFEFIAQGIDRTIPIETQVRDCIRYMQEITSAMKYIYNRGYLHCDLKPENILLKRQSSGTLTVMLTDFDTLRKYNDPSHLTGTEAYLPPSYIKTGLSNDITTEFFALGKTLHDETLRLASFTMLLSGLEQYAKSVGNDRASTAISVLIHEITSIAKRLINDDVSDYTRILKDLDLAAIQFEAALAVE